MAFSGNISSDRLCCTHWAVLIAGCLVGLVAAVVVSGIPFDFSSELAEAKRLGIVSKTILTGYPKSRDVLSYAAFILLPVTFSLAAWLVWSRGRRGELAALFGNEPEIAPVTLRSRRFAIPVVVVIFFLATFNVNRFYVPTDGWYLLGEEGQHLAWAHVIQAGGVYARDFFCLYGPLLIYPQILLMDLFGNTLVVQRAYTYGLNLIGFAILVAFLHQTIRSRGIFILAALFSIAVFPEYTLLSPNGSFPRIFLGFVPLLVLGRYLRRERKLPLVASGFALGISMLFSQEAGFCGMLAIVLFLCLEARNSEGLRLLVRQGGLVAGGGLMVVAPMLIYFYQQNALGQFFDSMYGYPKLVTLGYAALPFPSVADFLTAPLTSGAFFPYWIIGIYILTAISVIVSLFLGLGNRDLHFMAALLLFGMVLFRVALGRSDAAHIYDASAPAFLLAFMMIDKAVLGWKDNSPAIMKAGRTALAVALLVSLGLSLGSSNVLRHNMSSALLEITNISSKFKIQEMGVMLPQLPRAGIFFEPRTAENLVGIGNALDRHTQRGEEVLFFPNEAGYYFLFDRPVPTAYVHAYLAVTSAQRREMVADLERRRPAYVVYSLDSWRIDNIPEHVQVPEVVAYLNEKYTLAEDLGGTLILRRKGL